MKGGNAGFALVGPIREGGKGVPQGAEILRAELRAAGGQSWEIPAVFLIAARMGFLLCVWCCSARGLAESEGVDPPAQ